MALLRSSSAQKLRRDAIQFLARGMVGEIAREAIVFHPAIFGDRNRVSIAPGAVVNDTLFNTASGSVVVERYAGLAHGVSVLTGTHDTSKFGLDRLRAIPPEGRDVHIGEGAWIASNATILGPCRVGAHAVVAAGSVVHGDVPAYAVVAGVPARIVSRIPPETIVEE
jgi:acetyltransferase-like isoleucine patch superfamily enzyme